MVESKICKTCGRTFTWRKKWSTVWEQVQYCSTKCKTNKPSRFDKMLEDSILKLLNNSNKTATICPTEVVQIIAPERWKENLERTKQAARRLAVIGKIKIQQNGKTVNPLTFKGPIRIKLNKST